MKTRESGMPDEGMWDKFFDPEAVLNRLRFKSGDVVEFGCGYGTFTLAAAKRTSGVVHALDIDPTMVELVESKAGAAGIGNIRARLRDFITEGTGLPVESVDYVMLFNILHCEEPQTLLREAWRVLKPGGSLGIMHWRHDSTTPRGPTMAIRPRPEDCHAWAVSAGFNSAPLIDLPPYHYGLVMEKPTQS